MVPEAERPAYQRLVRAAFSGDRLLPAVRHRVPGVRRWALAQGLGVSVRPRDLTAEHWAGLYGAATYPDGGAPVAPSHPRTL